MLVDNNNIKPAPGSGPGWWDHLVPPAKEVMVLDKTVSLSSPLYIKAGDSIGYMGYYQAPKDGGYEARYQVHIECTSMDENLEKFLTNPDKVGGEKPPLVEVFSWLCSVHKRCRERHLRKGGDVNNADKHSSVEQSHS